MPKLSEFERYIKELSQALGRRDRHAGFADYSRGLMLPIERKSVEPLAAHTDPLHVSAKHQWLHHLVAQSEWSDSAVLACVRDWVLPMLRRKSRFYWIVDDTGFPKKGAHWRLYLPEKWAKDRRRRKKSGVPLTVKFLTKPQIALEQIRAAKAAGVAVGMVLADAGHGNETACREARSERGLEYCLGVEWVATVWGAGTAPAPTRH